MAAITIPEEIEPGELLAYSGRGDDFLSVVAGGMPNGDDYLQVSKNTTPPTGNLQAFQQRRTTTHMLRRAPQVNAMSFWIRRHKNWDPSFSLLTAGSDQSDRGPVLFGVGDPLSTALGYQFRSLGWAIGPYFSTAIQFYMTGQWSSPAWIVSQAVTLPLNEWILVVVNVSEFDGAGYAPATSIEIFGQGVSSGAVNTVANSNYWVAPSVMSNYAIARFAIGDPTAAELHVDGAGVDGPLYDLGKLTFHDRLLTPGDQLSMIESMLLGPASP